MPRRCAASAGDRRRAGPEADAERYVAGRSQGLGQARETRRSSREKWWVASYSGLQLQASAGLDDDEALESDESQEPISAEEATFHEEGRSAEQPPVAHASEMRDDLHRFPRGPAPGTFLHGLLEWAGREGFEVARADAQRRRELVARRCDLRAGRTGPNRSICGWNSISPNRCAGPVAKPAWSAGRLPGGNGVLVRHPPGPGRGDRRPGPAPYPWRRGASDAGADPAERHVQGLRRPGLRAPGAFLRGRLQVQLAGRRRRRLQPGSDDRRGAGEPL